MHSYKQNLINVSVPKLADSGITEGAKEKPLMMYLFIFVLFWPKNRAKTLAKTFQEPQIEDGWFCSSWKMCWLKFWVYCLGELKKKYICAKVI